MVSRRGYTSSSTQSMPRAWHASVHEPSVSDQIQCSPGGGGGEGGGGEGGGGEGGGGEGEGGGGEGKGGGGEGGGGEGGGGEGGGGEGGGGPGECGGLGLRAWVTLPILSDEFSSKSDNCDFAQNALITGINIGFSTIRTYS